MSAQQQLNSTMQGRLVCAVCHKEYSLDVPVWRCECGGLLDAELESRFPLTALKHRKPTLWRYREALPITREDSIVSFQEGFTPLVTIHFGGKKVFVKLDYLFPSGSYKDRGASVLVSKLRELKVCSVVEDSSGNAGAAIACYCARAGIACEIFVPDRTSKSKLRQIESYGAQLTRIKGTREQTAKAALQAAEKHYYASHVVNPYFFHGTKTLSFEICEQLNWCVPDTVILPVGNGTLLIGVYLGFTELFSSGIIHTIPKLIGVQAAACAPLAQAFSEGLTEVGKSAWKPTIAEGIAIAEPVRGHQILTAVRMSNGSIIMVEEEEIKVALQEMCRQGFYIEPTAAATIAGVKNYISCADPHETIVSVLTGTGLKTGTSVFL
jgi:threonine synthase